MVVAVVVVVVVVVIVCGSSSISSSMIIPNNHINTTINTAIKYDGNINDTNSSGIYTSSITMYTISTPTSVITGL